MGNKNYTDLDREIIVLSAVWDLIGSMVHYGYFVKKHRLEETTLIFNTSECSRLFIIMLADFLSKPSEGTFTLKFRDGAGSLAETYLGNLLDIGEAPHFQGDVTLLKTSAQAFANWLDDSVTVKKVWLPSIEREGAITVQRKTYLKICGTLTKHGFTRLGNTVKAIQRVLANNGTAIDEGQSYLVIPDFQDWFRDHVFIASSSIIAWHLNEIRWGLFQYLRPEFERAFIPYLLGEFESCRFDVPAAITNPLIKSMYWDLMNSVRREPYFPRFTVQRYLWEEF
ncbi:hypothetical protein [Agrobacterium pusense]|uniref:hypothetical protein n=1 Tax=Agrobacterium pusense TaxID=648995 RepID=UPI0011B21AD9|nr:hypothetical protein [Agrobacterium pusense]